eukprot:496245-Pleurochrysis_carterae.AAC.1
MLQRFHPNRTSGDAIAPNAATTHSSRPPPTRGHLPPPPPPLSLSDEAAEPAREHESLLAVLALPYVKPFCLAYGLLKPIRFTLQFWLPYYLQVQRTPLPESCGAQVQKTSLRHSPKREALTVLCVHSFTRSSAASSTRVRPRAYKRH